MKSVHRIAEIVFPFKNTMKIYLLSILILNLFIGGICYLLSDSPRIHQLKYLSSLIMILALISPLIGVFQKGTDMTLPELADSIQGDYSQYTELLKKETAKTLKKDYESYIRKKTGLGEEEFALSFSLSCTDTALDIREIQVTLYTFSAVYHREEIRNILSELNAEIRFYESL